MSATRLAAGLFTLLGLLVLPFWAGVFVGLFVRGVRLGAGW